jgi:hypothetical protein
MKELEYWEFIKRNAGCFKLEKARNSCMDGKKIGYILFTIATQHVYGKTLEDCIDRAIVIEKAGTFNYLKRKA